MLRVECDRKGRLYLKEALRSRYGEKFVIVEAPHELILLPVPKDPVKDLAELGRPLRKHSLVSIKRRIREQAKWEAIP